MLDFFQNSSDGNVWENEQKRNAETQKVESGWRESCAPFSENYWCNISVLGEAGKEEAWIMDGTSAKLQVLLYYTRES